MRSALRSRGRIDLRPAGAAVVSVVLGLGVSPAAASGEPAAERSRATAPAERTEPVRGLRIGRPRKTTADTPPLDGVLRGPEARHQLVASLRLETGEERDATHRVAWSVEPEGVVALEDGGVARPLADGEAVVTARFEREDGPALEDRVRLRVEDAAGSEPVSFPVRVVPLFTKLGCNGGGCHGKSGGQNGFRLSLLGFYPREDYEYLTREARGRRVRVAAPGRSLLLLKATNALPHGGGARMEPGSRPYELLHRWMRQGMPWGGEDGPVPVAIDVWPEVRSLGRNARQQLSVRARWSDGHVEDVTRVATYESGNPEMAEADGNGLVRTHERPGEVAVMVRYRELVGVFRAVVPLGVEVEGKHEPRNFIDELVFARHRELGIPASGLCDDPTFLRRVTIDLTGRLPTIEEARSFLEDERPDRRTRAIDRLLASPEHAEYFATKWSAILRNRQDDPGETRGTYAFYEWLRDSFYRNRPWDEVVADIIAASGDPASNPPAAWYSSVDSTQERVEDSAQLFLGLRIQCARCHHHPFERWSQRDYYGYTAFFTRVGKKNSLSGRREEPWFHHRPGKARARNPRSGESLPPTGLGGEPLEVPPEDDPREALVDWMTAPENPYFARAFVNRYWKHFFGRGLVEPEDDLRVTNPACHPELLDALAERFVESGYDIRALCRAICRSATYQLTSIPNEHNERDTQAFSRFLPRRLDAEVLYDAFHQLTGTQTSFRGFPKGYRAVRLPDSGVEHYFLTVFGKPRGESSCECERTNDASLAQSLHLMNSKQLLAKLSSGQGRAARLARDETRSLEDRVEELYLCAFSRRPRAEELRVALGHLEGAEDPKAAFEDVVWALLNTKEFLFNH